MDGREQARGSGCHGVAMKRVFITGMSGTGKSSVIRALTERGYRAVDADHPGYSGPGGPGGAWSWRVDRIEHLLDSDDADLLFFAGASDEQRALYSRFDVVILLSAPLEVILDRVQGRADNPYGSLAEDREQIMRDYDVFEPALRRRTPHVIDTRMPLDDVVAEVLAISIDAG